MFRANDPIWSQQAAREGLGQDTGLGGRRCWKRARAGARMAFTGSQIALFMKQR
jgi:hypothetical protein